MPRFRYDGDFDDHDDVADHRPKQPLPPPRRRPNPTREPDVLDSFVDDREADGVTLTTYPEAIHGPRPTPGWVVTSGDAVDTDRGPIKTGKEADVHLVERHDPDTGVTSLLAAKRYRGADRRSFHRDSAYLEGRRIRKSRETRAMANRTAFGRRLIAQQWAATEFAMLGRLWASGVAVPYPVQLDGTELMLEFIGTADGTAAPRLAEIDPDGEDIGVLWQQCVETVVALGATGYTHGDLSPYNVLVADGRLVLIDLPQVVDIVINPQGAEFLARDCRNICAWFERRGIVDADADELSARILAARPDRA